MKKEKPWLMMPLKRSVRIEGWLCSLVVASWNAKGSMISGVFLARSSHLRNWSMGFESSSESLKPSEEYSLRKLSEFIVSILEYNVWT